MEQSEIEKLMQEIFTITFFGEPTDFHEMEVDDISFIPSGPWSSIEEFPYRAEDIFRVCQMNICKQCNIDLAVSFAVEEETLYLRRRKCEMCGTIGWREPREKICRPCCDMKNMCGVCRRIPLLPISSNEMPASIMTDFVRRKIKKLSKRRQPLIIKAVSNRWREYYVKHKISKKQATKDVEEVLKFFLALPERF